MIRTPEALIPYVLALAALLGGLLWHLGDETGGLGRTVTFGKASIGGPFALIDQNGAVRTDKDFRGKWELVYFGYTHCPDVCPITLSLMADTLDRLGAKAASITPIFITVDPARDTPSVMKSYVAAFGKNFVGLTGSAAQVGRVMQEYHVYAKKRPLPGGDYGMDHSGEVYLMDAEGKFVAVYDDSQMPKKIADEIRGKL